MRRLLLALFVLTSLALGACSDDDGSVGAPAGTTVDAEDAEPPDEPIGGTGNDEPCAAAAEAEAPDQAYASFPDNPGVTWNVAGSESTDGIAFVEVVPTPDEVGYPRFRLVSRCEGDAVVLLGAYALDGGVWVLLFTTDAPGSGDLDLELG